MCCCFDPLSLTLSLECRRMATRTLDTISSNWNLNKIINNKSLKTHHFILWLLVDFRVFFCNLLNTYIHKYMWIYVRIFSNPVLSIQHALSCCICVYENAKNSSHIQTYRRMKWLHMYKTEETQIQIERYFSELTLIDTLVYLFAFHKFRK